MLPTALIVTLQMEAKAAEHFTQLRQKHFPPERNWLDAHITLFHALPVACVDRVVQDAAAVADTTENLSLQVDRVQFLGAGVAYGMTSAKACGIRDTLATRWAELLGRQDANWPGRLHVTVQNKVPHQVARDLHAELVGGFNPYEISAVGLQIWFYVGGPWRPVATLPFRDPRPDAIAQ